MGDDDSARQRRVVISWIKANRRSSGLADALGADAIFMAWARSRGSRIGTVVGWLRSGLATIRVLRALPRGSAVVVMVPPVWAALAVVPFRRRLRIGFDVHSGAVNLRRWKWSIGLLVRAMRRADAVIVTNLLLLDDVSVDRDKVVVVLNPSLVAESEHCDPVLPQADGTPTVVFPASGEDDEPLDAVAGAAELLAGEVRLVATGSLPDRLRTSHLVLSGFLPDSAYEDLIASASAILALTTREATNQRSAAEAIARGLPLVCSDTAMLAATYGEAALLVDNDARSIADGIRRALADETSMRHRSLVLRRRLVHESDAAIAALSDLLS